MVKIICLVSILVLIAGCATTAKYEAKLNTWIGAGEDALIGSWGVPHKVYHMESGKKAIEYLTTNTVQTGGHVYTVPQTTQESGTIGGQPYTSTSTTYVTVTEPLRTYKSYCRTSFIFNKEGKVESWHHEGNNCISN